MRFIWSFSLSFLRKAQSFRRRKLSALNSSEILPTARQFHRAQAIISGNQVPQAITNDDDIYSPFGEDILITKQLVTTFIWSRLTPRGEEHGRTGRHEIALVPGRLSGCYFNQSASGVGKLIGRGREREKTFPSQAIFVKYLSKQAATLGCFIYRQIGFNGIFSASLYCLGGSRNNHEGAPRFSDSIRNTSAVIGKDAVLNCYVESLGMFKVGWMRSDQTVLSVGKMVTQNSRYSVSHEEGSKWSLKIHSVRESDEGCYICQINTHPLLKASGCIQLQYPPDISDEESSTDTTIHEGRNVTLHCSARGNPQPRILWRRDDGTPIKLRSESGAETTVDIFNGSSLKLVNARRDQMSAYLCIAVNGVEPAISKRIFLHVQCEPRQR